MRISDWSSDVCSSDLQDFQLLPPPADRAIRVDIGNIEGRVFAVHAAGIADVPDRFEAVLRERERNRAGDAGDALAVIDQRRACCILFRTLAGPRAIGEVAMRSEEHTSELQSLMRISYAVVCLK